MSAALLMAISAASTAMYAYLLGPVLKTLFLGAAAHPPKEIPASLGFFARAAEGFAALDPMVVGLSVVVAAAVKSAAYFGSTVLTATAGQRLLHQLRCRLYRGLLFQNPLDGASRNAGTWTVRFTSDVTQIEEAVTKGIVAYFQHGFEVVALAILALSLDPMLGLLGLIAFPPAAAAILGLGKKIRKKRAQVHEAVGDLGTAVGETAAGLAAIHAFDLRKSLFERFALLSRSIAQAGTRASALRAAGGPLNEILAAVALAATLIWAARRIAQGDLAPESFISFFSALFLLYQPVKGLGQAHHATAWGIAALDRITPLLRDTPIQASNFPRPASPCIAIENASVGYGDAVVLRNLTLHFSPGEHVAVVGPSGSGKTTLLNLLLGLIPVQDGKYLIDNNGFTETDRRAFAPVRQEPFLFDDSILENVRIGALHATADEIERACRSAGVLNFAAAMKDGLKSPVGPFGQFLSVGQRQRVCLARALVSGAPVLLLDEVTAALDGETEHSIVDGLKEQPQNRTIIVVTHRRAAAEWANRIILIENGTVAADGPAHILLREDRRIAALFGTQA